MQSARTCRRTGEATNVLVIIKRTRIRSLGRHLRFIQKGDKVVFGIPLLGARATRLKGIGFSDQLRPGETVLPAAQGPVSTFNAEGKYIKHKDRPMETAYRQVEWHWLEFHGPYDRVEQSRIVDVPYERYPRTFIPPPSVELSLAANTAGDRLVVAPAISYERKNEQKLLHVINLFLEIFSECHVFREDLGEIILASIRKVNWEILPRGKMPWAKLKDRLGKVVDKQPEQNQVVISRRLETINQYGPEFVAVGRAGFYGYLIFGFPTKKLFVLESVYPDNATYIFDNNWKTLSQMTKAEILNKNLQKDRIIHRENWFTQISDLLA